MADPKILFVVGAGASAEVGLPTGYELREIIARKVDMRFPGGHRQESGSHLIVAALKHLTAREGTRDINPYLRAGRHIRDAMPQAISIDNFIDNQGDPLVELCGKLAITEAILEAERKSPLHVDRHARNEGIKFAKLERTWFGGLLKLISEGTHKDAVSERSKRCSFIVFNYDRCLETFLYYSLQNYYAMAADKAAEIVSELTIIHPYGAVGKLPWISEQGSIPFGEELTDRQLLAASDSIKTFTEQIGDDVMIQRIQDTVREADVVVFLGFGYHLQNMELLVSKSPSRCRRIYGTAKSISASDVQEVETLIKQTIRGKAERISIRLGSDLTCQKLFDEHWRGLRRKV
tara:strand:- start:192 stop:1235 length:1044 start_codon:yes stop_codon:yes gene_type:complete